MKNCFFCKIKPVRQVNFKCYEEGWEKILDVCEFCFNKCIDHDLFYLGEAGIHANDGENFIELTLYESGYDKPSYIGADGGLKPLKYGNKAFKFKETSQ